MGVAWFTSIIGGDERLTSSCSEGVYGGSQPWYTEDISSVPTKPGVILGSSVLAGRQPIVEGFRSAILGSDLNESCCRTVFVLLTWQNVRYRTATTTL